MKDVKVLGPGCKRCETTEAMLRNAATRLGIEAQIEKVTDYAAIASYGVVSTPAIVIDGRLVHAGGLPREEALDEWLAT
ncbi:small redox-active disulfide protein 2 [Rhodopseudomonas julia]|uniref:Small redox-active disulfide protein 2 n=1 Tax=Rhodopseudomonas julia TaxID=200617 RepID=A0ABU0C0X1_9BRAD|nr:thioredoxin family protein [Rhodopseudomonas julia]MDQ0324180.1 small redox-active disulfide protein 2 [Rhodopseudomonas julia]